MVAVFEPKVKVKHSSLNFSAHDLVGSIKCSVSTISVVLILVEKYIRDFQQSFGYVKLISSTKSFSNNDSKQ